MQDNAASDQQINQSGFRKMYQLKIEIKVKLGLLL